MLKVGLFEKKFVAGFVEPFFSNVYNVTVSNTAVKLIREICDQETISVVI